MEPGRILAHYELGEKIGKGGMGEVYRAKDTKLGREVALKVLPPEFAADSDRMARFEREAKVLASLHHPNIASIFGFERTDDCTFLVMELVEGEDLSEVLRGGALPVDEAVDVARQIAEGLEEAHEKGIVHRDLKPANVKRTPDGKVKVLDFGLARAFAGQSAGEEAVSSAPTMTAAMTQVGTVLGTAAYMSPEQARGKEVDRRADIWAFGVILFELLTGKQTFMGETASDTLAGILKSEPEWDALPANMPFQVERVLRRCLAKEPRQRLRDIGEARVRLEDPAAESGMFTQAMAAVTDEPGGGGVGRFVPWAAVVVLAVVAGFFALRGGGGGIEETLHLALPAPDGASFHITGSFPGAPEVSPDGRMVAFSGLRNETNEVDLYLRSISESRAVKLPDTRDAQYPFWSPDSRWVAYYDRNLGLMKVPVDGGPSQKICEAGNGKGGSWNEAGEILLTMDYNTSIFVTNEAGGEPRPVSNLEADDGFNSHRHPQFLPDGRRYLYFARGGGERSSEIRLASLDDSTTTVLTTARVMGFYASGHLVYVRNGDLVSQPLDLKARRLVESPKLLVTDVMLITGAAKGAFSVSAQGSLVYLRGSADRNSTLTWVERNGRVGDRITPDDDFGYVSISPDERYVATAYTVDQAGTWDISLIDRERELRTRFTTHASDDTDPVWSKDSRKIYFTSDRAGRYDIYRKALGSPDEPELVFQAGESVRLFDVSADESTLFISMDDEHSEWDLYAVDISGDEPEVRVVRKAATADMRPQLSPDEKWLGFASGESGVPHVYVAPWPEMAPVTQVSMASGTWFAWTKGGSEIIYHEMDGTLSAVPIRYENGEVRVGRPLELFSIGAPDPDALLWSVGPEGETFAVIDAQAADVPRHVNLVMGWPQMVDGD